MAISLQYCTVAQTQIDVFSSFGNRNRVDMDSNCGQGICSGIITRTSVSGGYHQGINCSRIRAGTRTGDG